MRRALVAFSLSLAVHLGVLGGAVAYSAWRGLSLIPRVRLQTQTGKHGE